MKKIFFVLSFCLVNVTFSQGWRSIDQSDLNVKYKLPKDWELDGFGGGFGAWDDGGSSVCNCAGTINFGYDRKLGMVIYPFNDQTDTLRRQYVWDYHFIPSKSVQTLTAKKLSFQRVISNWELTQGSDEYMGMLDDEVWQLTTKSGSNGLIVYFWGDESLMRANEKKIYAILDSMIQLKK